MKNTSSETPSSQGSETIQVTETPVSKWGVGERLVLEKLENVSAGQNIIDLHVRHYETAARYVSGKRVLDIACGSGYGSRMLRLAGARTVVGVDVSPEALQYAKEHYHTPDVEFICANAEQF